MERRPNLVAILACSDLDASERWWNRLGFVRPPDQNWDGYRMLADEDGCELHLNAVCDPGWLTPQQNPNGVYLYTRRVDAIAALMRDEIIEAEKAPTHKHWGMYEFALNGPDDFLVRIGWPSRLAGGRTKHR